MTKMAQKLFVGVAVLLGLTGCNSVGKQTGESSYGAPSPVVKVCSGYGCEHKQKFNFSKSDLKELELIMRDAKASPQSEQLAIKKAIARMENMVRRGLRHKKDVRKSFGQGSGVRGHMDCVDESLNTTAYLTLLKEKGWLHYHTPRRYYAERGLLVDGRYPHKSAVMIDNQGTKWSVDSWYGATGEEPRIMLLKDWRRVWDSWEG